MKSIRREKFYFRLGIFSVIWGIWSDNYFMILGSLVLVCTSEILGAIRKEPK